MTAIIMPILGGPVLVVMFILARYENDTAIKEAHITWGKFILWCVITALVVILIELI